LSKSYNADEKDLIIDDLDVSKNSRLVQYERHSKGFEPNIFRQEIENEHMFIV